MSDEILTFGIGLPIGVLFRSEDDAVGAVRLGGEPFELSLSGYALWTAARFGAGSAAIAALDFPEGEDPAGVLADLRAAGLVVDWGASLPEANQRHLMQGIRPVPLGSAIGQDGPGGDYQIGTLALEPVVALNAAGFALWSAFDGRRSLEGACADAADALAAPVEPLRAALWVIVPMLCQNMLIALDRLTAPPAS